MLTIKPGILRIATYKQFYPVCYSLNGHLCGTDVDIIREFAYQEKLIPEFVTIDRFDGIWDLPLGDFDIAIDGIAKRRLSQSEWTTPYQSIKRSLLFHKRCPIGKFPDDINGHIISTFGSTGWYDAAEKLKSVNKYNWLRQEKTDEEDINDLLAGRAIGLIRGDFVSEALCKKYSELDYLTWEISSSITCDESFTFPCKPDSGIAKVLSNYIKKIQRPSSH